MRNIVTGYSVMGLVAMAISIMSCSTGSSPEDREVKRMDSVSTSLENSGKELDAKTKNVEASLEKIDKEFNQANNGK